LLHFGCRKAQDDELGDHAYTKRFEVALSQPRLEGLVAADGVLWAAYEDALKGDLKPVVKERGARPDLSTLRWRRDLRSSVRLLVASGRRAD